MKESITKDRIKLKRWFARFVCYIVLLMVAFDLRTAVYFDAGLRVNSGGHLKPLRSNKKNLARRERYGSSYVMQMAERTNRTKGKKTKPISVAISGYTKR